MMEEENEVLVNIMVRENNINIKTNYKGIN